MRVKLCRGVVLSHEVTTQFYKENDYNENYNLAMNIPDFLVTRGECTELFMTIEGECPSQNGWKLKWRGAKTPTIYDPLAPLKKKLNNKLLQIFANYGHETPYFKKGTTLEVTATFYMDKCFKKRT